MIATAGSAPAHSGDKLPGPGGVGPLRPRRVPGLFGVGGLRDVGVGMGLYNGRFIRVRNHHKHQHYGERRNPPWIKWHRACLDSVEFSCLPDAAKWHAVGIALLASQTENHIPADPKWIAAAIRARTTVNLAPLLAAGFVEQCDCLACCEHGASTHASKALESVEEKRVEEKKRETPRKPPKGGEARFDAFWSSYPRKVGKQAARRSFMRQLKKIPEPDALAAVLETHKASEQWQREGGKYIPHPATWLNQGRWEDEVQAPVVTRLQERIDAGDVGAFDRLMAEQGNSRRRGW